jgi:hypothetical protein
MATRTQRIYKDDYKISVFKGDDKTINVGVYNDPYRKDEKVITGYTCVLKTDLFESTGITYDENNIQFNLTSDNTNNTSGLYPYEIYIVNNSTDMKETIIQDNFEIRNVI